MPPRVISLIGPDRDLFLNGRRAENLGLGLGAFAYYRQVVEIQKGRLISQISEVAKKTDVSPDVVAILEKAAKETQFSKAIAMIRDAIPPALLIDGHNPSALLHDALSSGLHAGTDEECLESANAIRVVLTDLSDRVSVVLKEQSELKQALSRLLNRKK